jgi:hypothetical protein
MAFEYLTRNARVRLATDRLVDLQDLAAEASGDLLKKHHRPVTLKEICARAPVPT